MGEVHTITCAVSFANLTVKTTKNPLIVDEVTDKNKLAPFMAHGVESSSRSMQLQLQQVVMTINWNYDS